MQRIREMDISTIREQVSNLTLYDIKAGVRKVQNAVMNYTEMEAKVREATNNEPWGASTTLMQEIANGTHSFQLMNEIMPLIYKRFTDKSAEEWRQIYKSLQLLEFLVKNGSERVVDDARSHISLLRMLRQFHFIDQNGKDQGVNVRNRSSELVKLLGDVDMIRAERKKARANRNKFSGFEGGMSIGNGLSGNGSRYGGFGSDSMEYGGYSGGVYGDGGGYGGASNDFQDYGRKGSRFEEYDEYDEGDMNSTRRRRQSSPHTSRRESKPTPPKEPELDLFDFGEEEVTPSASIATGKQPAAGSRLADEDDFDDFQSAVIPPQPAISSQLSIHPPISTVSTTSHTQFAAPQPISAVSGRNLNGLAAFSPIAPTPTASSVTSPTSPLGPSLALIQPQQDQKQSPAQLPKPSGYQAATPNYFTSVAVTSTQPPTGITARPGVQSTQSFKATTSTSSAGTKPAASKPSGDAFGSLWSSASAGAGIQRSTSSATAGPNLASMAKEKASAGIWGTATPPQQPLSSMHSPSTSSSHVRNPSLSLQQQSSKPGSSGLDDLLG